MNACVALVALAAALAPFASSAAPCEPVPEDACERMPQGGVAVDSNVVVRDRAFTPAEISGPMGTAINFQNLDPWAHTVTDVGCVDGTTATPCRFNYTLRVNGVGYFATRLSIDRRFQQGRSYGFVCTLHPGMTGRFTVA